MQRGDGAFFTTFIDAGLGDQYWDQTFAKYTRTHLFFNPIILPLQIQRTFQILFPKQGESHNATQTMVAAIGKCADKAVKLVAFTLIR